MYISQNDSLVEMYMKPYVIPIKKYDLHRINHKQMLDILEDKANVAIQNMLKVNSCYSKLLSWLTLMCLGNTKPVSTGEKEDISAQGLSVPN